MFLMFQKERVFILNTQLFSSERLLQKLNHQPNYSQKHQHMPACQTLPWAKQRFLSSRGPEQNRYSSFRALTEMKHEPMFFQNKIMKAKKSRDGCVSVPRVTEEVEAVSCHLHLASATLSSFLISLNIIRSLNTSRQTRQEGCAYHIMVY